MTHTNKSSLESSILKNMKVLGQKLWKPLLQDNVLNLLCEKVSWRFMELD